MTFPSRKSLIASLAAVPLVVGLALVPATSASAATGQLSVTNNCGYALTYYVIGAGNDYATPGQTRYWTLNAGSYTISSSGGVRSVYVMANRGLHVNLC